MLSYCFPSINNSMKRTLINDMPWQVIQAEYDSGLSIRDIGKKRSMSGKTFANARRLGLFTSRTASESLKIKHRVSPRDYSAVRSQRSALTNYRANCAFKFNLINYSDEFEFTLVERYGWYKAKNRGDNQTGVSRDHAVSVRYGFDNNLPAEHLSHPANCVLMQHGKNVSKGKKNTMSYEELLNRIEAWDKKYGLLV